MDDTSPATFDRRAFLARAGVLGAAAALWQVPGLLRLRGWDDPAYATELDLVRDTLNGLVAMVFPGDDAYSVAQEQATGGPGGVAAGTTAVFTEALDHYLPVPAVLGAGSPFPAVPLSGAVANLLNVVALTVDPAADRGPFLSPFARLSVAGKAAVFRFLEEDVAVPDHFLPRPLTRVSGNLSFVAGILPGLLGFLAFSEWHVFDPETRTLTAQPVGWGHTGYQGGRVEPVEGWDELRGYFQGRREVTG